MNKIDILKSQIELYKDWCNEDEEDKIIKAQFLVSEICDIDTYDTNLDVKFANDIIEIMDIIFNCKTFEYIESSEDNYIKFITIANLIKPILDWGTSIRGCFIDEIKVNISNSDQKNSYIKFVTRDEIKSFIDYFKEETI